MRFLPILIFCLYLFSVSDLHAKQVLGKPLDFENPVDYFDQPAKYRQYIFGETQKSRETAWLVVSDRANNPTFSKPNGEQSGTLQFGKYYYVLDETEEWIEIISASVNGLEIVNLKEEHGWVRKDKMLLWTSGLISQLTGIHQKAFLLNRAEDISNILRQQKEEIVPIFTGPVTGNRLGERMIYQFFFVYKKENNRYLLAEEVSMNTYNIEKRLIGWIEEKRLTDWNTRVAVEPNFDKAAFSERQTNPKFQIKGYKEVSGAKLEATTGVVSKSQVLWDNDPVVLNPKQLARTNNRRFKGGVVRFPYLSSGLSGSGASSDIPFFRSGVIGEIVVGMQGGEPLFLSEISYSEIMDEFRVQDASMQNMNLLLVIEATEKMAPFKESIVKGLEVAVGELSEVPNLSVSIAFYRDAPESGVGKLFEILPLTNDHTKAIRYLKDGEFRSWQDNDKYASLHYGLYSALNEAKFNPEHTNIVISIGNYGDYRGDKDRRIAAKQLEDKTLINTNDLIETLKALNAHFYAIQCKNDADNESIFFIRHNQHFMLESAKSQYNEYQELKELFPNYAIIEPSVPGLNETNEMTLKNSAVPGKVLHPGLGNIIDEANLILGISGAASTSYQFVKGFNQELSDAFEKGNEIPIQNNAAGKFTAATARFLYDMVKKQERSNISNEDIIKVTRKKYRLFTEVYFPKKIKGANNSTVSYILYMPDPDLRAYVDILNRCVEASEGSNDKKREALFNAMWDILKRFSGNPNLKKGDTEGISVNEFLEFIQGVKGEGLELSGEQNFLLGDILSERKMNNEELNKFIRRIQEKYEGLQLILRRGKDYEFSYTSGNDIYYWIPVEDAF